MRAQLIILALFIALPLLVGSAIRIYSRSVEGRAQITRELGRTTNMVVARVDERVHSADAVLVGLTPSITFDSAHARRNDAVFVNTLTDAGQR